MKKKQIVKWLTATKLLLLPSATLAFSIPPIIISDKDPSILSVINKIVDIILGFTAALAALFIIIGGIRYMASQGNAEAMESAKKTLLYAVVGLLIVVLVKVIINLVTGTATTITG